MREIFVSHEEEFYSPEYPSGSNEEFRSGSHVGREKGGIIFLGKTSGC